MNYVVDNAAAAGLLEAVVDALQVLLQAAKAKEAYKQLLAAMAKVRREVEKR